MTDATNSTINFRYANRDDLPAIVALLADDEKGKTREDFCESFTRKSINAAPLMPMGIPQSNQPAPWPQIK